MRREEKPCSWYCEGLGEVDFQANNFRGISLKCAAGNVYTVDLCGNLPCLGQTGVMACSNVTGPAMNLSGVIVTTSLNSDQPTGLQINFHGSNFSIALAEGLPDIDCVNSSDSFQAFIVVLRYPIVPPVAPATQPNVGLIAGLVAALAVFILLIVCTVVVVVCCVYCCKKKPVATEDTLLARP